MKMGTIADCNVLCESHQCVVDLKVTVVHVYL